MENLCVLYRSRDFLVVNKHWDVRIDSKAWRETLTLQKQLRHRFPELADSRHLLWAPVPTVASTLGKQPPSQPPLESLPILGSATN